MFKHKDAIYKEAAKLVMYHGTASGKSDDLLRRILKHGLEADPRKRRYEAPETTTMSEEEVKTWEDWGKELDKKRELEFVTYGGTYLASNLPTALGYAQGARHDFGGEMVIVVAQIETRSPEITIDEDQFISTVNMSIVDFNHQYSHTLQPRDPSMKGHGIAPGTPLVGDAQFYEALVTEDYYISKEDLQEFLAKFLKNKPVNVSMQELMRYEQDLRNIFLVYAEFEAATDFHEKEEAKRFRDPAKIAADFREEVNAFTKKIGKLADPVGKENRNVRSFNPVGYKGANRILGILVFDPEDKTGIVAYGASNPETGRAAKEINNILGVRIDYTTRGTGEEVELPYVEQEHSEDYVEILINYALGEAQERMDDWWGNNDGPLQEILNLENLQNDTGVPAETLSQVLEENKEEISEWIDSNLDPYDLDYETWATRLDFYETARGVVKDTIQCMENLGLEEEVNDSDFFQEVVALYTIVGYYEAVNEYFNPSTSEEEEQVKAVEECLGYSGEGPLSTKIYHLQERLGWGSVYSLLLRWFDEEYVSEQPQLRQTS